MIARLGSVLVGGPAGGARLHLRGEEGGAVPQRQHQRQPHGEDTPKL